MCFLGARPVLGTGQIVINKAGEQVSVLTELMILVREGTKMKRNKGSGLGVKNNLE